MAFVHCKEMRFWQIIREVCVCIGTGKLEGRCWPGRAHYCEEPCQCCVCVYVRVDACVWFRICVNMASILLLKTKKKKKENVTICTFFLNRALVSPVSVGQSCVDANTIAKPQLMGLCLLHILDRKKMGHLLFLFFFF